MAPLLAARLGFDAIDLDAAVEAAAGEPIAALFARRGEAAFRDLEAETLRSALADDAPKGRVVACGGGILERAENRDRLRAGCFVIWLRVSPQAAATRLGRGARSKRPLLAGAPGEERLRSLLDARQAAYETAADAIVDTDGRSAEAVADEAASRWRGLAGPA